MTPPARTPDDVPPPAYRTDPDFLGMCERWKRDGRALLIFADWFEDRGMIGQARAWAWAANEPDRVGGGGVRPKEHGSRQGWFWLDGNHPGKRYRSTLPDGMRGHLGFFPSHVAAVAWFLDRWAAVFGDSPAPVPAREAVA